MPRGVRADGEQAQGAAASLLNGLKVLEAFTVAEPALGVTEIARRVDLHKSTVSRILNGLAEAGYVERETDTGLYRLSFGVIGLAGPLLAELDVRRVSHNDLVALTEQTRETSALSVWSGSSAIVVEQIPSPQYVKHTAYVGTRYDRYESSSVRVFLAFQAPETVERMLEEGTVRLTSALTSEQIRAELESIRASGHAVNDGLTDQQEFGVSALVFDHAGGPVACITISAPRSRIKARRAKELISAVRACADRVSHRLGYTGPLADVSGAESTEAG